MPALEPLPVRAKREAYEAQARALVTAFKARDPQVLQSIRQHHPRLPGRANTNDRNPVTEADLRKTRVTLADARTIAARWHGFADWPDLAAHLKAIAREDPPVLQFELAVEAIIAGDTATLSALLRANPGLIRARSTREHHATLLHYVGANAVEGYRQKTPKNAVRIARILLQAGAEVDADLDYSPARKIYPERGGSTTLGLTATSYHPAAAGVQLALLDLLLKAGASVDGVAGGWNPLLAALHNGRGDAAAFLAERGARLDLEGAAGVGDLKKVKSFFDKSGSLKPEATREQLELGFAWACEYGRSNVVRYLVKQRLDINAKPRGETGLHWASYGGHTDVVKSLLKAGARLDIRDDHYGGTPLGWAFYGWCNTPPETRKSDYYATVAALLEAGAQLEPAWLADRDLLAKVRSDRRMRAACGARIR